VENLVEMNSTMSFTDPGAALGRAFLKIGQVLVGILTAGCVYLAYLASEGFFSDWKVELDEDLTWLFPHLSVDQWIVYLFIGLALKFIFWFGLLAWIERKI
jgi:hypothetical protein